ncbi:hypothetical protein FRB95_013697 [Tulasnella sp. JGI-2019a]|nr:hypothetical protein FRB95_013697 [Tulasnella sp. JGI-2019a]
MRAIALLVLAVSVAPLLAVPLHTTVRLERRLFGKAPAALTDDMARKAQTIIDKLPEAWGTLKLDELKFLTTFSKGHKTPLSPSFNGITERAKAALKDFKIQRKAALKSPHYNEAWKSAASADLTMLKKVDPWRNWLKIIGLGGVGAIGSVYVGHEFAKVRAKTVAGDQKGGGTAPAAKRSLSELD